MNRHNPALAAYLLAWQDFSARMVLCPDGLSLFELANEDLIAAIAHYRAWQNRPKIIRPLPIPFWQGEASQLHNMGGEGVDVLLIPSLINGHEILDLCENASLSDYLKAAGFRVHLLTWNKPNAGCSFSLSDYVDAIKCASHQLGAAHHAIGYCIGGTLLNLAAPKMPKLCSQILLGAPWNFHHDQGRIGAWAEGLKSATHIDAFLEQNQLAYGLMPSLMVDHFFAALNPLQLVQKFRTPPTQDPIFDALEDWLNSGHDLSTPLARELLKNWMRDNALMATPIAHHMPTLLAYGTRDHIAPPASCLPVGNSLSAVNTIAHPSGHVGLMVGRNAREKLWPKLVNFLQNGIAQE